MAEEKDGYFLEYQPKYRKYRFLMRKRIVEILLVSSIYDSFIMEEDMRLSDQIYEEFHSLNLRTLPHISRASSVSQAFKLLEERDYDLVITMRRLGEEDPSFFAEKVKQIQDIPVILLLNNSTETRYLNRNIPRVANIDKVFVWNGNTSVFVAIIKLLEDQMNVDQDTSIGDVRVIIVVENSIRFYSLYLPALYSEIMRQTHHLIHEGRTDYHSLLQMSSRPKILLACTYEEAMDYYNKYKDHLLGVITDIKFPRDGVLDPAAGFELVQAIRQEAPTLPILFQSSGEDNREKAISLQGFFVNKFDRSLIHELRSFMQTFMGFGPFTFRLPNLEVIAVAHDLFEFRELAEKVPIESLVFHAQSDHFSGWLSARGEFEMSRKIKPRKVSEFEDMEDLRLMLLTAADMIVHERLGTIVDFDRENFRPGSRFIRLRPGSLGGKGRGIAFLLYLRSMFGAGFAREFPNIYIQIPKTYVIGTDEFDIFMRENELYDFVISDATDVTIRERFVNGKISDSLRSDLEFIFKDIQVPLAVRSSSNFEDSLYQPFAGVFATYMIPNCNPSLDERIEQLVRAIKLVYASTYLRLARSYAETIDVSLAGSRMAVIIQEVVGNQYEDRYYPTFAGSAASYNYYPLGDRLQPEDRIAHLVLGLGKAVVDGGLTRQFSPKRPRINLNSGTDQILKDSQREFYAIKMNCQRKIDLDEGENSFLARYDLRSAIQDKTLTEVADTFNHNDGSFSSGFWSDAAGFPVITFNRQLKYGTFPMAQIINRVLILGEKAMGCPVEIEFAGILPNHPNGMPKFYLLQLRPFMEHEENLGKEIETVEDELFVYSNEISGNRLIKNIQDVVYVKPESFDSTKTNLMVSEINQINKKLIQGESPYILIGPGRWGTNDRHLGIPVDWSAINGARVILEVDLVDFKVDHSQGSHFFHNITSAGIPYFCVRYNAKKDFLDWEWLEKIDTIEETTFFKQVRTQSPMLVLANGKKREGRIIKPDPAKKWLD
jgi:DNA-binding NarL/FixJ family response regulator